MAIRQRQEAIEKYYKNPSTCQCCGKVIEVIGTEKIPPLKKRKFCSKSCSAKVRNSNRRPIERVKRFCGIRVFLIFRIE